MTLLEMIKKYEDAKAVLEKQRPELPILAGIADMEQVLEDLKSIREQQPSRVAIRDKIMKKIDARLNVEDFEGVRNLAQALHLLYLPE